MMKIILIAVWALIIASLVISFPAPFGGLLPKLGMVLVAAHIIEYFVFNKKITAKKDGTLKSFLMTMVFGVVYIKNL